MRHEPNNGLNPQLVEEAKACVQAVRKGTFAAFPTDAGWCVVCDASNPELVEELLASTQCSNPCILLDQEGRLSRYCGALNEPVLDLISYTEKPLQLLLEGATNPLGKDKRLLPFMIATEPFANRVASSFGKPLMAAFTEADPHSNELLNRACHVVNLRIHSKAHPNNIVAMRFAADGSFQFIKP
jgi:L-threonylcarbamoyladenylate synthase